MRRHGHVHFRALDQKRFRLDVLIPLEHVGFARAAGASAESQDGVGSFAVGLVQADNELVRILGLLG